MNSLTDEWEREIGKYRIKIQNGKFSVTSKLIKTHWRHKIRKITPWSTCIHQSRFLLSTWIFFLLWIQLKPECSRYASGDNANLIHYNAIMLMVLRYRNTYKYNEQGISDNKIRALVNSLPVCPLAVQEFSAVINGYSLSPLFSWQRWPEMIMALVIFLQYGREAKSSSIGIIRHTLREKH